jgi:hypothetical protein
LSAEDPTIIVTNQKLNGYMGIDRKTLLVERHDFDIEGIFVIADGETVIECICSKTGTQVKIGNLK